VLLDDRVRWPVRDQFAACAEHQRPVYQRHHLVKAVLHDDERVFPRGPDLGQQAQQVGRAGRVKLGGRLVQHQNVRLLGQHAGQRQPLLLPPGEPLDPFAAPVPQADQGERLVDLAVHLGTRHREVLQAERHFVLDAQHAELGFRVLEHDADPSRKVGHTGTPRVQFIDAHRPVHGPLDGVRHGAVETQRQRALAAAARPKHQHRLPTRDRQRDVPEGRLAAANILEGERVNLDHQPGFWVLRFVGWWATGEPAARPYDEATIHAAPPLPQAGRGPWGGPQGGAPW